MENYDFLRATNNTKHAAKKKHAIIYGNCTGGFIKSILNDHVEFNEMYDSSYFACHRQEANREQLLEFAKTADLVICQPIYNYEPTSDKLLDIAVNAIKITYPVPHFNGYFPDVTYLRTVDGTGIFGEPIDYHSKLILKAFVAGYSVVNTARLFSLPNLFEQGVLMQFAQDAIERLTQREADLDVKIAEFVKKNYRERQLFYTVNHPTSELLFYIVDSILAFIGISPMDDALKKKHRHVFEHIQWPISYSAFRDLGLSFSSKLKIDIDLTTKEFVEKYYRVYTANPQLIEKNLPLFSEFPIVEGVLSPLPQSGCVCNICGNGTFQRGPNLRLSNGKYPTCANCFSLERHRVLRKTYEKIKDLLNFQELKAIQFSQDLAVDKKWFSNCVVSIYGSLNSLDIQNIDLPDFAYDVVICNHVLEHVQNDKAALAELFRITSEKGFLQISVPEPINRMTTVDWGFPKEEDHGHYRIYGKDVEELFQKEIDDYYFIKVLECDDVTGDRDICYFFVRSKTIAEKICLALNTTYKFVDKKHIHNCCILTKEESLEVDRTMSTTSRHQPPVNLTEQIEKNMFFPCMSEKEVEFFSKILTNEKSYLEYGCGGSTILAALTVKNVVSIDSSIEWVSAVKSKIENPSVFLEHVDVGQVKEWGYPVNFQLGKCYTSYITYPWEIAKIQNISPDVILVDGRFRVACFLYSLICSKVGSLLLVHDYPIREYYHIIETYCSLVSKMDTLYVFEKKPLKDDVLNLLIRDLLYYSVDAR